MQIELRIRNNIHVGRAAAFPRIGSSQGRRHKWVAAGAFLPLNRDGPASAIPSIGTIPYITAGTVTRREKGGNAVLRTQRLSMADST